MNAKFTLDGLAQEQISNLICDYYSFECGLRGMAPDSIKGVYLPGVLRLLLYNRISAASMFRIACADDSVALTFRGFCRLYNLIHPAADRLKLAFTASSANLSFQLLRQGRISFGAASNLPAHLRVMGVQRIYCALLFGIMFLLRKSEFLVKPGKPFPPSRASIFFLDIDRNIIADAQVGIVRAEFLTFKVDQSKTDQQALGRVNTHQRQPGEGCFVATMEDYYRRSFLLGAKPGDCLVAVPGLPVLTSSTLSQVMKDTVTEMGLPASRVSTHSLRYGGASMLAARGFPEYIIAMYGGWAEGSLSMRRYTRPSHRVISEVSRHMRDMQLGKIEDDLLTVAIAKVISSSRATR